MYHPKHFFVPSENNNYRAKTLHLDALTVLLGIAILLSSFTSIQKRVLGIATNITIERLLSETNEVRTNLGLPSLSYDGTLSKAACNKAQDMFTNNYWAHFRPSDNKSPWDFMAEAGYAYDVAGENLAHGFMFSENVVDAWMESPTHRANLLRPEYDEVGFCVSNGVLNNEETTLVVQMFGKKISQAQPQPEKIAEEKPKEEKSLEKMLVSGTNTQKPQKKEEVPVAQSEFISLDKITFNSSLILFSLLLLVFVTDLYFAHRMNLIRITGKNVAHFIFLAAIIIAILIIKNGAIL